MKLYTNVRANSDKTYIGYVSCYLGKARLWIQYTNIKRYSSNYALNDANKLLNDIKDKNVSDSY